MLPKPNNYSVTTLLINIIINSSVSHELIGRPVQWLSGAVQCKIKSK